MLCQESTAPSSSMSLYQDWRHPRTASGFTGNQGSKVQSTILRCVTNTLIPCTAELFASMGKMRFNVTVLSVASTGNAKAPNKKGPGGKYMKLVDIKPLFEDIKTDESIAGVRMFAFKKANSNTDRGERDDETYVDISVGQVLTFWIHDFMYIAKDNRKSPGDPIHLFPTHIRSIPEFSIIDLQIMTSHNGNENGYGIKVQRVQLHPTTLYSYLTNASLRSIPVSYSDSVELAKARSDASRFIHNMVEVKNTAFFSRVPANSFISASPVCEGVYRMVGDGGRELFPGVPCVDINESDLLKFANIVAISGDGEGESSGAVSKEDCIQDAITLFDFASAAESLYLYVTSVPTFKSRDPALSDFLGVPMVDSDGFLKSIDIKQGEEGEMPDDKLVFLFKHEIVNFSPQPIVTVYTAPVFNAVGPPAPCPDFALMFDMCSVAKGYLVTVGKDSAPDVLKFVFNVMGCQFSPNKSSSRLDYAARGGKRKAPEGLSPDGDE